MSQRRARNQGRYGKSHRLCGSFSKVNGIEEVDGAFVEPGMKRMSTIPLSHAVGDNVAARQRKTMSKTGGGDV